MFNAFFLKLRRYVKIKDVDVSIYYLTDNDEISVLPKIEFEIEKEMISSSTTRYFINYDGSFVHHSYLYKKKRILKVIDKKGPIIGDCVTKINFRGKSIYPFVLNYIARDFLSNKKNKEIFVLVANKNKISIRGIEKSGFKLHSKVKAKRFLFFYYNILRE